MTNFCKYGLSIPLLATMLMVTACGIKPKSLDAPAGADKSQFPKTYPTSKE